MVRWTTGIWYIGTGGVDESTEDGCCTGPDEQCPAVSTTTYFLWRSQALIIHYYRKVGGTREADDLEGKKRVSCTGSGISTTFLPTISLDRTRGSQRPPPLWEAIMTISSRNSPLFNQAVYVHGDDATRWRRPAAGLQHPYPDDGPHMTCKSQKWPLWDAPINSTSFPPPRYFKPWVNPLTRRMKIIGVSQAKLISRSRLFWMTHEASYREPPSDNHGRYSQ